MDEPAAARQRPTISVTGSGRATRTPDQADVTLSVESTELNAADAQAGASERMRGVHAELAKTVPPADLSTRGIGLEPVYDYRETGARLTGYRASQALGVRVRTLDDLGPLIDRAVTAGATGIAGVSIGLADPAAAEAEARTLAVSDARMRARELADAAGVELDQLVNLEEGGGAHGPPRPMMRMAAEAMAGGTPVAEGSLEVVVEVRATYAIAERSESD